MVDAPTDERLLQEYLRGKTGSFELLVRRHAAELFQFVQRFTADSVTAEDVVQESFLQVHLSAVQFDPQRRFKPWLFTIAANKARDHLRRKSRRREVASDAQLDEDGDSGRRFIHLLSDDAAPPDEELLTDEKRRVVREVLAAMPDKLREVLILAYYHRFAYKDIGDVMGIPLGTVKSRLHAAIALFGEKYRETAKTTDRSMQNRREDD